MWHNREARPAVAIVGSVAALLVATVSLAGAGDGVDSTTVHLREYRFDPPEIHVVVGRDSELIVVNDGTVPHEFVTDALQDLTVDVEIGGVTAETLGVAELEIPPKARVVVRFTPERAGEFRFACHAMRPTDHYRQGMIGRLVIRER
ncbi:MAG: cupredoxin domain-containing protein [Nitrospirae bacterium]|nr:cupredoxin domain-containing protein [Nitrospirota bacterium]